MSDSSDVIPAAAKQLFALGDRTERAVRALFAEGQRSLFPNDHDDPGAISKSDLQLLARAFLDQPWTDEQSEQLISHIAHHKAGGGSIDIPLISRWVLAHPNDAESVIRCMTVIPPNEIEIRKVLSRAGSQKIVFLGTWRLTQRQVVVKQLLRRDRTADRELQSFPLTLSHRHIIETHRLQNQLGELFLVEDLLPDVLNDNWHITGIQDAANFLHDIGSAIKHIHDHGLVHGDIKPDNIGRRQSDYILLDFGICRPIQEFAAEPSATGSLRTRAPELLATGRYVDPPKVDIWALGATLFSAYKGRFPLLEPNERVPRISHPAARGPFEVELRRRVTEEWHKRVEFSGIPADLESVLRLALAKEPRERATSSDILADVERRLPAFIRRTSSPALATWRFSPSEELQQISDYLTSLPVGLPFPHHKKSALRKRLLDLENTPGFSPQEKLHARDLADRYSGR